MKFSPNGIHTALITPFTDADEFDEATFRSLIDFQIDAGASGLLVIGGSGEFVSLTPAERQRVVEAAVDQTAGRIPVTVGALAPGTREVQDTVHMAANAKADAECPDGNEVEPGILTCRSSGTVSYTHLTLPTILLV